MKNIVVFLSILLFNFAFCSPVYSQQDLLSFGIGYYDINKNKDPAADIRVEYRWARSLFGIIKPWAGAEISSDVAIYGLGGLLLDMQIADNFLITPSFGAGLYHDGHGKNLGHTIEFRSQIEIGYKFENETRLGIAFGHISNASLGDKNPGTEILSLYYHVPILE